jgi:hypothetical protein
MIRFVDVTVRGTAVIYVSVEDGGDVLEENVLAAIRYGVTVDNAELLDWSTDDDCE